MSFFEKLIQEARQQDPSVEEIQALNEEEYVFLSCVDFTLQTMISKVAQIYFDASVRSAGRSIESLISDGLQKTSQSFVLGDISRIVDMAQGCSLVTQGTIKFLVDHYGSYEKMIEMVDRYMVTDKGAHKDAMENSGELAHNLYHEITHQMDFILKFNYRFVETLITEWLNGNG